MEVGTHGIEHEIIDCLILNIKLQHIEYRSDKAAKHPIDVTSRNIKSIRRSTNVNKRLKKKKKSDNRSS